MERIKESVFPSGVPFSVRNLIGDDQDNLTEQSDDSSSIKFNKMLQGALRSLGDKKQGEITLEDVANMLSNDRKFGLVTLRQHTLKYKEEFNFKFEFPLRKGKGKDKEAFDYAVKFSHENFPVTPYWWVREEIANKVKENPDFKADGHIDPFPKMYSKYSDMLAQRSEIKGMFPECGLEYKWNLLDGNKEALFGPLIDEKMRINMMLEMRALKYLFKAPEGSTTKKDTWAQFEVGRADVLDLEHVRGEIKEKEGTVDTFLTIQHPTDVTRVQRVDLVTLPVFFFPSQAL